MKNNSQRAAPVVMRKRQPILSQREILIRGTRDMEQRSPLPDFPDSDNLTIDLLTGTYKNNGLLANAAFTDQVFWEYRYNVITYACKLAEANKINIKEIDPNDPPDGAIRWELIFILPKRSLLGRHSRDVLTAIMHKFIEDSDVITLAAECKIMPRSYNQIKPHIAAGNVMDDQYFDFMNGDILNINYTADVNIDLNKDLLLSPSISAHI